MSCGWIAAAQPTSRKCGRLLERRQEEFLEIIVDFAAITSVAVLPLHFVARPKGAGRE